MTLGRRDRDVDELLGGGVGDDAAVTVGQRAVLELTRPNFRISPSTFRMWIFGPFICTVLPSNSTVRVSAVRTQDMTLRVFHSAGA